MAKRLWDKGAKLDAQMHQFTVGNDPELDARLVHWDLLGSAAHARMLRSIGVLTAGELDALLAGLRLILEKNAAGTFVIPRELEDCHTAIESFLVEHTGDAGLKIHTGRSRNDQVLLATRLYLRHELLELLDWVSTCIEALLVRSAELGHQPMPGYTHFQPAMPSSIAMWLNAFVEAFLETFSDGIALLERINTSPLGTASGFGSPLPLDRASTARLLGFSKPQRNPIDVQNSRGRYELKFIRWCTDVAAVVEKLACDLILYTTREFGFFSLPKELTTGSSIMPQKHNPDVIELLRARTAKLRAAEQELLWVTAKLPSHYHRDFQYTKEPLIRAAEQISEILPMFKNVVDSFSANSERLAAAMTDDLYATYDVYREVKAGVPFREAYRKTAQRIGEGTIDKTVLASDFNSIAVEVDQELKAAKVELLELRNQLKDWHTRVSEAEASVIAAK